MKLIFLSILLLSSTAWSATDWLRSILRASTPGTCQRVHIGKVGDGRAREQLQKELLSALNGRLADANGDEFDQQVRQSIHGIRGLLSATHPEELQISTHDFHLLKALINADLSPESLKTLRLTPLASADGSARLSSQSWEQLTRLKRDFTSLSNIVELLENRHIEFRDPYLTRQWVYNDRGHESERIWSAFKEIFADENKNIQGPEDLYQFKGTLDEANVARQYLTAYFDHKIPISSYLPFAVHCLFEYDQIHGTSVLPDSLATIFPKAIARLDEARQRVTRNYSPPQVRSLSLLTGELYIFAMDMSAGFDQVIAPFAEVYRNGQGPSIVLGMDLFLQRERFSLLQIRQYFEEFKDRLPAVQASETAEIFLLALMDSGTNDALYRAQFIQHSSQARRDYNRLIEVLARSFEIFNDSGYERVVTARWRLDRLQRMLRRAKYDIFSSEQHPEVYLTEFRKAVIGLLGLPKGSSMLARKTPSRSSK